MDDGNGGEHSVCNSHGVDQFRRQLYPQYLTGGASRKGRPFSLRSYDDALKEATELHKQGKYAEALGLYNALLEVKVEHPFLLYALGTLYLDVNKAGTAIPLLERAVFHDRKYAAAWANLGVAYKNVGEKKTALSCYYKALALEPNDASTMANVSGIYVNAGNPDECIHWARKGLAIDPNMPELGNHLALALLEKGDYENGWKWYESRLRLPKFHRRDFGFTLRWEGSPVRTLAIHGEQGLGDEIMFMSCFADAKRLAERIVVECSPRLIPIFQRSFNATFYGSHEELIAHERPDAWSPMGSLPGLFRPDKKSFPKIPYLIPREIRHPIPQGKPIIGIAWRGGTKATHEETRTTVLDQWAPILSANATFVSLQYGDQRNSHGVHTFDHGDDIDELTALAAACDLVISVDQTIVHQCGAIGKPCWVLTPNAPSFRYGIAGDMDWYPSIRLYRQKGNDWTAVIQKIASDLETFCADYAGLPRPQYAAS